MVIKALYKAGKVELASQVWSGHSWSGAASLSKMLCAFAIAIVSLFSCRERFSTLASPSPSAEESCYSTSGMAWCEPSPCELFSRRARGVAAPLAISSASFRLV